MIRELHLQGVGPARRLMELDTHKLLHSFYHGDPAVVK
jgi:hypothetical protein